MGLPEFGDTIDRVEGLDGIGRINRTDRIDQVGLDGRVEIDRMDETHRVERTNWMDGMGWRVSGMYRLEGTGGNWNTLSMGTARMDTVGWANRATNVRDRKIRDT